MTHVDVCISFYVFKWVLQLGEVAAGPCGLRYGKSDQNSKIEVGEGETQTGLKFLDFSLFFTFNFWNCWQPSQFEACYGAKWGNTQFDLEFWQEIWYPTHVTHISIKNKKCLGFDSFLYLKGFTKAL